MTLQASSMAPDPIFLSQFSQKSILVQATRRQNNVMPKRHRVARHFFFRSTLFARNEKGRYSISPDSHHASMSSQLLPPSQQGAARHPIGPSRYRRMEGVRKGAQSRVPAKFKCDRPGRCQRRRTFKVRLRIDGGDSYGGGPGPLGI